MSGADYDILSKAVENTTEAFVTIDQEHRVVFFNQAAEKMFGYTREEVLGRDLTLIMVTHDPEVAAHADRILQLKDGQLVTGNGSAK